MRVIGLHLEACTQLKRTPRLYAGTLATLSGKQDILKESHHMTQRECISHHAACDCREQSYKDKIEALEAALKSAQDMYEMSLDAAQAVYELAQESAAERELDAEIRGAAWACDWYWSRGLRHHGANPAQICFEARKKPGI
jgi:hypothetical protein